MEAVLHVKESMQIAEDALMEKDQVIVREQQCVAENGRLKKALDTILQEAGERTRSEVGMSVCIITQWQLYLYALLRLILSELSTMLISTKWLKRFTS